MAVFKQFELRLRLQSIKRGTRDGWKAEKLHVEPSLPNYPRMFLKNTDKEFSNSTLQCFCRITNSCPSQSEGTVSYYLEQRYPSHIINLTSFWIGIIR